MYTPRGLIGHISFTTERGEKIKSKVFNAPIYKLKTKKILFRSLAMKWKYLDQSH